MLSSDELKTAIRDALQRLERAGINQAQVAKEFGIKPPSVNSWKTTGRISKQNLSKLIAFCQEHDIAGPEHWGLAAADAEWRGATFCDSEPPTARETRGTYQAQLFEQLADVFDLLTNSEQQRLVDIAKVLATDYGDPPRRTKKAPRKDKNRAQSLRVSRVRKASG